jgi:hypothetical protein
VKTVILDATFRPSAEPTVGRMCRISPELADYEMRKSIDGFDVELRFPAITYPLPSAGYSNGVPFDAGDDYRPEELYPMYFSARTIFEIVDDPEDSQYIETFQSAVGALRAAATRLSDSIRIIQPSVGIAGECPELLTMTAHDAQTKDEIIVPVARKPGYGHIVGYPALTIEKAKATLEYGPSPTKSLLAQASYLSRSTADPQPGLAVLLAAVACEAHAKEILLELAEPAARPLLDTLLHRPRIFQEPAAELFGHVAKAVIGKSLQEENKDLWKNLTEIFQLRNKMAHMADRPPVGRVRELVVAATQAIAWLDDIRTDLRDNHPNDESGGSDILSTSLNS